MCGDCQLDSQSLWRQLHREMTPSHHPFASLYALARAGLMPFARVWCVSALIAEERAP